MPSKLRWFGLMLVTVMLFGCTEEPSSPRQKLTITIAHMGDHVSYLNESHVDFLIGDRLTRFEVGGFPRAVEKIKSLARTRENILKIHAGNAITGQDTMTLFRGAADASQMNEACFHIFNLGHTDLKGGDSGLQDFLTYLLDSPCQTQVLSANLSFDAPQLFLHMDNYDQVILPHAIAMFGQEPVGIIGVLSPRNVEAMRVSEAKISVTDPVKAIHKSVKKLEKMGVNKIILVSSLGYAEDAELIKQISGVSVIVGSGSHTLLGDFKYYGLPSIAKYPAIFKDQEGKNVCVVHAWDRSRAVGELQVEWDASGYLTGCQGNIHLLLGSDYWIQQDNQQWKKPTPRLDEFMRKQLLTFPSVFNNKEDPKAKQALSVFMRRKNDEFDKDPITSVGEIFCQETIPGLGRSDVCSIQQTQNRGSDIANLMAKSFLMMVETADIALISAGSARMDLTPGPFTQIQLDALMLNSGSLVQFEMTGKEIKEALEQAIDYSMKKPFFDNAYPYASGLRWKVDFSQPKGSRVLSLEVNARVANEWTLINMETQYSVVVTSQVANGKRGYALFETLLKDQSYQELYTKESRSFRSFVERIPKVMHLPKAEYSTQQVMVPVTPYLYPD